MWTDEDMINVLTIKNALVVSCLKTTLLRTKVFKDVFDLEIKIDMAEDIFNAYKKNKEAKNG